MDKNTTTMNLSNIITGICSLLFFMIGIDKFLGFLQPPCSLESSIPTMIWKLLGAIQIASGTLIWHAKFKKLIVGFFSVFMIIFSIVHLTQGTYDIGGSTSMAVMLGLLAWNPSFIGGRSNA